MEKEILDTAIESLKETTGIVSFAIEKGPLDGILEIILNGKRMSLIVEIKNEIRAHHLHQLESYNHQYENLLVVANRIFPSIKEQMRLQEINYLEANGNFFFKKEGILIFIDTQKPMIMSHEKRNRAFTKTGLKVLFYLLQHKNSINLTQRELAEKVGVGLGNIPQVIEGLKETGYLVSLNNREVVWENRKALLQRWVDEYGTLLKPKLKKERYTYQGNWNEIQFNGKMTVWGGEPAADLLTKFLRPEKFILYTKETRLNLMKNYRLIPKQEGEIEALEWFWKEETKYHTAPPLLVYADLMLEGGKRNKETAEKIFNEFIQSNL